MLKKYWKWSDSWKQRLDKEDDLCFVQIKYFRKMSQHLSPSNRQKLLQLLWLKVPDILIFLTCIFFWFSTTLLFPEDDLDEIFDEPAKPTRKQSFPVRSSWFMCYSWQGLCVGYVASCTRASNIPLSQAMSQLNSPSGRHFARDSAQGETFELVNIYIWSTFRNLCQCQSRLKGLFTNFFSVVQISYFG